MGSKLQSSFFFAIIIKYQAIRIIEWLVAQAKHEEERICNKYNLYKLWIRLSFIKSSPPAMVSALGRSSSHLNSRREIKWEW